MIRFWPLCRSYRFKLFVVLITLFSMCLLINLFPETLRLAFSSIVIEHDYNVCSSPNYNFRPWRISIDCIVLHATAMDTMDGALAYLVSPRSGVSTHYLVDKDGTIVQLIPINLRAWHAGVSNLQGRSDVNDFSVGIELVNRNDGVDPYSDAQYRSVAKIITLLRRQYHLRIPTSRIVSHAAIAVPPGRKHDPLHFRFQRLYSLLK